MKWGLGFLFGVFATTAVWAGAETYDYPIDDRWVATVVGTPEGYRAELPKKIPLRQARLTVFEDREIPEWFWYYRDGLQYSYALQRGPAPLVFLIAGTGASHTSSKNVMMAKAFYQAGFHIVSLSSPTVPNFVTTASETSVPGHAVEDAEDLYRVMELVWDKLKDEIAVTDFYVTGYSLGGFNTAFVTWLDEQRKVFNFRKALMINPPVTLYNSISLLDRMTQNIPGGVENFYQFFQEAVEGFTRAYKRSDQIEFGPELLYKAFDEMQPKDEELAALIGTSFRISSGDMIFTSDVMRDAGFVKPRNVSLTRNSDPTQFQQMVYRIGFTDYYHLFFYPYFKDRDPSITRDQLIDEMSLKNIEAYLRSADKIEVMHNENDIILEPGEIDFFREVFGSRAKIYPTGGHCGNMAHRDNVAHMVSVFQD
jgi:predicted alpha/beta-fold hydrolase